MSDQTGTYGDEVEQAVEQNAADGVVDERVVDGSSREDEFGEETKGADKVLAGLARGGVRQARLEAAERREERKQ